MLCSSFVLPLSTGQWKLPSMIWFHSASNQIVYFVVEVSFALLSAAASASVWHAVSFRLTLNTSKIEIEIMALVSYFAKLARTRKPACVLVRMRTQQTRHWRKKTLAYALDCLNLNAQYELLYGLLTSRGKKEEKCYDDTSYVVCQLSNWMMSRID